MMQKKVFRGFKRSLSKAIKNTKGSGTTPLKAFKNSFGSSKKSFKL